MFLTLLLGRLHSLHQATIAIHEVPHRPQLTVAAWNQDSHARLEAGRHADPIDLLAPDNPVALFREPGSPDLLALAAILLADEFHQVVPCGSGVSAGSKLRVQAS